MAGPGNSDHCCHQVQISKQFCSAGPEADGGQSHLQILEEQNSSRSSRFRDPALSLQRGFQGMLQL